MKLESRGSPALARGEGTGDVGAVEVLETLGGALVVPSLGIMMPAFAQSGYRLGTGDKLKVTVFGEEDASSKCEIDTKGAMSACLIGRVQVKDLTVSEVEQMLIDQYRSRGLLQESAHQYRARELAPLFHSSEVEKRGSYPYVNGLTVAPSGGYCGRGYTYRASHSRIPHPTGRCSAEVPVKENDPVYPGDIIRVPERFF
jgi:polysaccharide export outer membrane protein